MTEPSGADRLIVPATTEVIFKSCWFVCLLKIFTTNDPLLQSPVIICPPQGIFTWRSGSKLNISLHFPVLKWQISAAFAEVCGLVGLSECIANAKPPIH